MREIDLAVYADAVAGESAALSARAERIRSRLRQAKIERDLQRLVPREYWGLFPHLLIWHGRRVCIARAPRCEDCVVNDLCPSSRV